MPTRIDPTYLNAWRLFLTVHAALITEIDKDLSERNLIPLNWYDVLIELYEAPGKRLRMSELAKRVLLTRSGLTRVVDRLEAENYLTREIDPDDRRGFYAIITPEGVEAMKPAWEVYSRGIEQNFASYLDPKKAEILVSLFSEMLTNLER